MSKKIEDPMGRVRRKLVMMKPWWGTLSLDLEIVPTREIDTAATDMIHLWYNPEYLESLNDLQKLGLCAHEVHHDALEHPIRIVGRDPEIAGIAADHVVNLDLLDDIARNPGTMELPPNHYADPRFRGMAFEKVYAILYEEKLKNSQNQKSKSGSSGDQEGKGGSGSSPGSTPGKSDKSQGKGAKKGSKGTPEGKNGDSEGPLSPPSGSGSQGDPKNWGSIVPPSKEALKKKGMSGKDELAHHWEKNVELAALIAGAGRGDEPGQWISTLKESRVQTDDLRAILPNYITAKSLYSFASPNKRFVWRGIHLPGPIKSQLDLVVIAVDTSGSVSDFLLQKFERNANEILSMEVPPKKIILIYCDARIRKIEEFTDGQIGHIQFTPAGRGGTSFRPVFEHMETLGERPDVLIYLTDLEGDQAYIQDPGYRTLWVAPMHTPYRNTFGDLALVDPYVQ